MNYRDYDYIIQVLPVKPPLGGLKFSANISFPAKHGPEKATRLNPDIGEGLGKTKEEATRIFEAKLKKWIDAQE